MSGNEKKTKTDLRCADIFEDDVGAGDVHHVQAAADDEAPLMEVFSMSLFECRLQAGVLRDKC